MRQLRAGRLLLILVGSMALCAAPAAAQIGELPQAVIESTQPTAEQLDLIKRYTEARIADVESAEPARLKRGRDDLESPATNAGATIAFRTAYADVLVPQLTRLGRLENDVVVIAAIHIAGNLATGPAIELVERYRADQLPAVRYAAVFALRDTIRSISRTSPVVGPQDVTRIVETLGAGFVTEPHADVADMYVRALLAATEVRQAKFEAIENLALSELIQAVGGRVRKLGGTADDRGVLLAVIRASKAIRDVIAADAIQKRKPVAMAHDAGGLGGDLLAYIFRRVRAGELPQVQGADQNAIDQAKAARSPEITVSQLGLNLVFAASDRLARGQVPTPPPLVELISEATARGDKQFIQDVGGIIGVGGLLTRDPFNFNADRFLR